MRVLLGSAIIAAALGFGAARADTIINLSTGLDASGNLITTSDATDANWMVNEAPASVVTSDSPDFYSGWLADGPNSSWIAIDASTTNNGSAPYTFFRGFSLTGIDLSTVTVSGAWAVDDAGVLTINGHQISALNPGNWGGLTSFSVPQEDLLPDDNLLGITITQSDEYLEGVRLEGGVDVSVPEPVSLGVLGIGFVGLAGLRRRGAGRR